MKKSMKLWLVLAIVVLLAVAVPSLVFLPGCNIRDDSTSTTDINKGTVVGTVTDAGTGNGIENVTVTIVEQSAKAVISDETDADGNYNLPNVAPGTQTITAKKSGYANYSQTVEVTENITVTQDISMNAVVASTVSGSVASSADDSPIVGAKVWIDEIQDYSDSTGNYVLNGVSAGTVVLKATISSYADYQLTMTIEEGTTVTQNISLDESNEPAPPPTGKSNVYGRVTAAYKPVANATVKLFALDSKNEKQASPTPSPSPTAAATTQTDTDGLYEFLNVSPGNYRVEVTADGYDTKTETVTATSDENSRVDTVSLAGGPSPSPTSTVSPTASPTASPGSFTTKFCSKPYSTQQGNSQNAKIDDNGKYVVFQSNDKLLTSVAGGSSQIYTYDTTSNTITLVSQKSGTEGNGNSTLPCISPDGTYVAFTSAATNLIDGDSNAKSDIFLNKIGDNTVTRISTKNSAPLVGANGDSDAPCLNNSTATGGFFCVFQSDATDIIPTAVTPPGPTNIFMVKIDKTTGQVASGSGSTVLVSQIPTSAGNNGVAAGLCANPMISRDGKYVVYESNHDGLVTAVAPTTPNVYNIYYCDTSSSDVATRTQRASADGSNVSAIAGAGAASVSDNGRYVAFEEGPSAAWGSNAGVIDVFRKDMTGKGIETLSKPITGSGGTIKDSQFPWISGDGDYVAFQSDTTALVLDDTNGSIDVFVRYCGAVPTLTRVSVGESGQQAEDTSTYPSKGSCNPYLTGNYVVFHSSAHNLVPGITGLDAAHTYYSVYARKWK